MFQQLLIYVCPFPLQGSAKNCLYYIIGFSTMQSAETHAKQIALLHEYIEALERQIAATHKEITQMGKIGTLSQNDLQRTAVDLKRTRIDNDRLKSENTRLVQEKMRAAAAQRELKQLLDRQLTQKNNLLGRIEEMATHNRTLFQYHEQAKTQITLKSQQLETELKLNEEKNKIITQLKTQKEQSQMQKSILQQLVNQKQTQLISLRQILKNKQTMVSNQINAYNTEILKLKQILKRLEENQIKLEETNNFLQETVKFQGQQISKLKKEAQEAALKMEGLQDTIRRLIIEKNQYSTTIADLQAQLQHYQSISGNLKHQKTDMEVQLQKIKQAYQQQIQHYHEENQKVNIKCADIEKIMKNQQRRIIEMQNELTANKKQNSSYLLEIDSLKKQLNQYRTSTEQSLKQKINQNSIAESLINELHTKIYALNGELQQQRVNADSSKQQMQKQIDTLNAYIIKMNADHQQVMLGKNQHLEKIEKQREQLKAKLQYFEQINQQNYTKAKQTQNSLHQTIKQLRNQLDLQNSELNKLAIQQTLQQQNTQSTITQQQILKENIATLESHVVEQKVIIQELNIKVEEKQQEIQCMEQSNATLRQIMINAKSQEEAAIKELLSLKSTVCSKAIRSRNSSINFNKDALDRSFAEGDMPQRSLRMKSAFLGTSQMVRQEGNFKKRTTPNVSRTRMGLEGEGQDDIQSYCL